MSAFITSNARSASLSVLLSVSLVLLLAACSSNSSSASGDNDNLGDVIAPVEDAAGTDVDPGDSDDGEGDDTTGTSGDGTCSQNLDCEPGEICINLMDSPGNGFCTTRCFDSSQCPDGVDCVILGEGESRYQVCIDPNLCIDPDGDGYGIGPGCLGSDCDESSALINPGMPEICDGIDNNCDGLVDNNPQDVGDDCNTGELGICAEGRLSCQGGVPTCVRRHEPREESCNGLDNDCNGLVGDNVSDAPIWYRDRDGDLYGDNSDTVRSCTQPAGYVAQGGDCDDTNRLVNPGMIELCDGLDNDCNDLIDDNAQGFEYWYVDADGDGYGDKNAEPYLGCPQEGYVNNNRDCDDSNAAINPEATEICDGIDNNCNGEVDEGGGEGATLWYRDADNDSYGDPNNFVRSCHPVTGYVSNRGDCDDTNPNVYPGATEVCDGIDNNCNGLIDEGLTTTYWLDNDNDGYGDPRRPIEACARPTGYVENNLDCNDLNAAIHPGATEVCNGVDDNCNGLVDDNVPDAPLWYYDHDKDGWGGESVRACTQPPGTITRGGDCNDNNMYVNPDAQELCSTPFDDNCDGNINENSAIDATWWFPDFDRDGQGSQFPPLFQELPFGDIFDGFSVFDIPLPRRACTKPPNACVVPIICLFDRDLNIPYVDNDLDCDDSTPRACRGCGPEVCDGYDNDCNGTRDDGFTRNLTLCKTDDYGNPDLSTQIQVCASPVDASPGTWVNCY